MKCPECREIWASVDERMNSLLVTGRRAEQLSRLSAAMMSADAKKEFAALMLSYQATKAEIEGLKAALTIHRRYCRQP